MSTLDKGIVFDVKKYSVHDGPGIRTTVFLKGCPLNCWWCHNPESQSMERERIFHGSRCIQCGACLGACPQGAIAWDGVGPVTDGARCSLCGACVEACYAEAREMVGQEMTVAQVMTEIERDVAFYDESGGGVTFSGGEPLAQPGFLLGLLEASKGREIHTALDTCGQAAWETLDRVRGYVDLFLYDLKVMDEARHKTYTGVSNRLILSNLVRLSELGHEIVLRVPVMPGINNDHESMARIGTFAAALPALLRVDLLPYHHTAAAKYERLGRVYPLAGMRPPSDEVMAEAGRILSGFDLEVKIGG